MSVFRQEWKKMWSRPEVRIAFILVCLIPLTAVCLSVSGETKIYDAAYEAYAGRMDADWRQQTVKKYEDYLSDPAHLRPETEYQRVLEEWGIPADSPEAKEPFYVLREEYFDEKFAVLQSARQLCGFPELTDNHVKALQEEIRARDPGFDLSRIAAAYETLKDSAWELVFDSSVGKGIFSGGYFYFSVCFLIFLALACASLFTGEEQTGMADLLAVSRWGRERLYWRKFALCQLLAFLLPAAVFGILAAAVGALTGWRGLSGLVQDFVFNACPFAWSEGQELAVSLLMVFAVCQVSAAIVFLLSAALSSTGKVICVSLTLLLLPVFAFQIYSRGPLRLYFTGAFQNAYLWADYAERRIGQIYLSDWMIMAAELCLIFGGVLIGIIRCRKGRRSGDKRLCE